MKKKLIEDTVKLWNNFVKLDSQHQSELNDMKEAIHKIQYILAMRICRKDHPDIFKIWRNNNDRT